MMSHTVTTEMAPTINRFERNDNPFIRSQSVPPERRKQPVRHIVANSHQIDVSKADNTNGKQNTDDVTFRRNKNWYGGMSFRGRKSDVRVSTINPDQFLIANELKSRLQSDGISVSKNGMINHQETNGIAFQPTPNKVKHSAGNGLVKMLQSVRRIGSFAEKHAALHTKTVEIDRSKDGSLGIFIKKRKVPKQFENGSMKQGIFVSRLDTTCKVSRENLLHVGDQILSINNVEITNQDVKMVAGMMCLPNNLFLKVRTYHKPENRTPVVLQKPQLQKIIEGEPAVKDTYGSMQKDVVLPTPNNKTATLNSMYDNDRVAVPFSGKDHRQPNNTVRNSVQIRFDESYKILLDAIADCEKPSTKNINNNSSSKITDITNIPETVNENFSSELLSSKVPQPPQIPEDYDSLLNEILSTIRSQKTQLEDKKTHSGTSGTVAGTSWVANPCSFENNTAHLQPNIEMNDDPDYDEVPTTDDESMCSYNEEVNVDAVGNDLKHYNNRKSLHKNHSSSTSSSSINSQTDFPVVPHQSYGKVHKIEHVNRSTSDNGGGIVHQQSCTKASMPKFPVAHTDFSNSECSCMARCQIANGITVDKKRNWLVTGPQVSDELQMRLEGLTPTSKEGKQRDGANRKFSAGYQKTEDGNCESKRRSSCKRRTSESSSSSGHSSNSPGVPRSQKSSLDSPSSVSDFILHRKNSLKTQIERSAKSVLSVSSPSSSSPKPSFFADNSNSQDCNVDMPADVENESLLDKAPQRLVSQPTLLHSEPREEQGNHDTSILTTNSTAVKITSPSRSRRKNWSKKISKKFKIGGNSENSMSEYTCWTVEEEQQKAYSNLPPGNSRVSTQHNLQKIINKSDSAVLNRYHLDISMAHQRRLSRQLEWDTVLPGSSVKALTPAQFKKYKPVPALNHKFLPAIDGCLVLTLYGVRELKKTLCEAYCLVQVDNATTKRIGTTMQTCRGAVAWNQCFELMVNKARDLHLTLYTWETRGGKHKISSYATLNLPTLIQNAKSSSNFSERLAVRLEPRGTLYMKVALEQNPSSLGPLVFGADLQSIVDRENAGYGIPSLVHSCISEVEKRGMQVVGIYRLCGSAIVKRQLRRKLEEAKCQTPLTSDNYPDVNVITGILKDFLRELPQPLFPPELLEAVTTAMEKNPGPTPATVVKEPFAPDPSFSAITNPQIPSEEDQKQRTSALLEQIKMLSAAPAERATLYALLNHLKKVAMHNEQNKMNCQNLAVCFGPVLLGPVNAQLGNGIDLSAAIGFKRHIQVLNYMLSNWPTEPVAVPRAISPEIADIAENRNSVNRMSCVSLTRRLSRVFIVDEGESRSNDDIQPATEKRGTLISMGRSESLNSILETNDQFTDPKLDMTMQESEDL